MIFDRFRKKTPAAKEVITRELYLIRHADALDEFSQGDMGRALSDKGFEQAKKTGQFLHKQGLKPDVIIYSSAVRTRSTAETIALSIGGEIKLAEAPELYNVTSEQWVEFIRSVDTNLKVIVAVGHNFGISEFASYLNGNTLERLENASVYGFQFQLDSWEEVTRSCGQLITQFNPV